MLQRAIAAGRVSGDPGVRERILRTAAQCFAKHGYERTRMTSVARIAGVSRAALYKHFSKKAELLRALDDLVIRRVARLDAGKRGGRPDRARGRRALAPQGAP